MSNVTYVSFLMKTDSAFWTQEQRLDWIKPLFELDINLIFFVDEHYKGLIPPIGPRTKLIPLEFKDLGTARKILETPLELPPNRNKTKDTIEYMALMNSKPELLAFAKPYIETPYVAYIDSGIGKLFKDPNTLKRLESLVLKTTPLVIIPGCWPMKSVEAYPFLWNSIHWMFCGTLFIVPTENIDPFLMVHMEALEQYMLKGVALWEVNVWASVLPTMAPEVTWYKANHDDSLITGLPAEVLVPQ